MIETLTSPTGMTAMMIVLGFIAGVAMERMFRRRTVFIGRVALFAIVSGIFATFWWLAGI